MSKKNKSQWKDYKTYTLSDGTKFLARDDEDAQLYIDKVGATSWMKPTDLKKVSA